MRPVGFMMATETLPRELLGRAPDQDRLLLGWRTGSPTRDLRAKARRLKGGWIRSCPTSKARSSLRPLAVAKFDWEDRRGAVTPPAA